MILLTFLAFLGLAAIVALVDWRRGWLLAVITGLIQDPIRKLIPGTPVFLTLSIVVVYAAVMFAAQNQILAGLRDFGARYPRLRESFKFLFFALIIAFCNGLVTFGIAAWRAPALSFFTYVLPVFAVIFGYVYLDRIERLDSFLKFYVIGASVILAGGVLEYLRVPWRTLGTVALGEEWIRHLPGIQVRILAGFFRGPDIMAWHAGTVAIIGLVFVVRRGLPGSIIWALVASWGFLNCMISGRRKMVYMVAIFALIFLSKYIRRLRSPQIAGLLVSATLFSLVIWNISRGDEQTSAYAKASKTTRQEISQRLEGGFIESFRQYGLLGGGLGVATQGAHHLIDKKAEGSPLGWQEGGAGKFAVELGLIGIVALLVFGFVFLRTMWRITYASILREHSLERNVLFAIVVANIASFFASAQPYTDPSLALITAFFVGALFATPRLESVPVTVETERDRRAPAALPVSA